MMVSFIMPFTVLKTFLLLSSSLVSSSEKVIVWLSISGVV